MWQRTSQTLSLLPASGLPSPYNIHYGASSKRKGARVIRVGTFSHPQIFVLVSLQCRSLLDTVHKGVLKRHPLTSSHMSLRANSGQEIGSDPPLIGSAGGPSRLAGEYGCVRRGYSSVTLRILAIEGLRRTRAESNTARDAGKRVRASRNIDLIKRTWQSAA